MDDIKMRKFYNDELQEQYQQDGHFRSRVDRSETAYSALLKHAFSESQAEGAQSSMLQRFIGDDNHPTYFFYGYLQSPPNRGEKELLLYLVRNFQPEPGVPFTFVYFNQHTPSSDYYFRFKNVFDLLPLRVIEKMRSFYLVKPYFYIKAFDMLGHSNRVFAEAYRPLDSCQELVRRENYKVHDFVTFVPEEISEEFPSQLKRRPSLLTYRINVEGQNLSEEERKEKQDFENSVRALITKEVFKLENYELGELGVPMILQLLVGYFKEKPQALLQEGIFRKSVSIDEENDTLQQLSGRNFGYLQQITNPHLIASLIKKFFTNLKEPIIPFALFDRLMHDQGVANKREFVRQQIATLPPLNFLSLMFVIDFLRRDVVPVEKETKMSAHNLAICFSPAFMRSEKPSFADIANASKAVTVTEIMINDFDDVFGHEPQRKKLFEKSMLDRRVNFKRNLKEELNINIDDRASEEVNSNSFILEGEHRQEAQPLLQQGPPAQHYPSPFQHGPSPPKTEPVPPQPTWGTLVTKGQVTLSKEVYKSGLHQQQPPFPAKSESIQIAQQDGPPLVLQQVKSESFAIGQAEQEQDQLPKSKKTRQQLVQLIMKNKQQAVQGRQQANTPYAHPHPEQKPSVTRSTITFHSSDDRN